VPVCPPVAARRQVMPEMDITGKLLLITVIGALIGAIVLYHL
jgi:hypothetical protein